MHSCGMDAFIPARQRLNVKFIILIAITFTTNFSSFSPWGGKSATPYPHTLPLTHCVKRMERRISLFIFHRSRDGLIHSVICYGLELAG
jgi:hypothetical protein